MVVTLSCKVRSDFERIKVGMPIKIPMEYQLS